MRIAGGHCSHALCLRSLVPCSPAWSLRWHSDARSPNVSVLPIRGGMYMISGPTSNTTVQVGRDGVLVVDTQTEALSDALLAADPHALRQADPDDRQHDDRQPITSAGTPR